MSDTLSTLGAIDAMNEALANLKEAAGIETVGYDYATVDALKASAKTAEHYCGVYWDTVRRNVLASVDWGFARIELPLHVWPDGHLRVVPTTADVSSLHPFADASAAILPSECLRVIAFRDWDGRNLRYHEANGEYHAEGRPSEVVYTKDCEDIRRWPPLARDALVNLLSARLATALTGNDADVQRYMGLYQLAIADAKLANAREQASNYATGGLSYADGLMRSPRAQGRRGYAMWRPNGY